MRGARLSKASRVCCCCGFHSAVAPLGSSARGPVLLSVSLAMYRRGNGKGAQRAAGSVVICEDCFARAFVGSLFGGASREGKRFLSAAGESLSRCYNDLVSEDCEPVRSVAPSGELFA
jgi:hypothetical protein